MAAGPVGWGAAGLTAVGAAAAGLMAAQTAATWRRTDGAGEVGAQANQALQRASEVAHGVDGLHLTPAPFTDFNTLNGMNSAIGFGSRAGLSGSSSRSPPQRPLAVLGRP